MLVAALAIEEDTSVHRRTTAAGYMTWQSALRFHDIGHSETGRAAGAGLGESAADAAVAVAGDCEIEHETAVETKRPRILVEDEATKWKRLWCQKLGMASGTEVPYEWVRVRWRWGEIGRSITWIGNMDGFQLGVSRRDLVRS